MVDALRGLAINALEHPLEHTHVLAVAGPDEFASGVLAEPVDAEQLGQALAVLLEADPVGEVVAHVVAAERKHGERVAANDTLRAEGSSRGLRAHSGREVHALRPVAGLGHQRHSGGAAATEDHGVESHTPSVLPGLVASGVVRGSNREAGVGVGGLASSILADSRGPILALPVDEVSRGFSVDALPPDVAVVSQSDVGEDHVLVERRHAVGVGVRVGARGNAEVASLRVDGVEATILTGLDPSNVVTNGGDAPALEALAVGQHSEVGLAAGARESGGNVVLLTLGVGHAHDEHVLRKPALLATHGGGNAKSEALLAEEGIATIARAEGPDLASLREVNNVLHSRVAGPGDVLNTGLEGHTNSVHARNELGDLVQVLSHFLAHTGHDFHVHHHVGTVRDLHASLGNLRPDGTHGVRHNVHDAALHAAIEKRGEDAAHLIRLHPVVGRASILLLLAADVGTVLNTSNVTLMRASKVAARALFRVQLDQSLLGNHFSVKLLGFLL
mmetsp:Transcript_42799/g.114541  ORF Transcript_42799/g.114541 Transcript_42799/m.114541 type:complete len:503 (-) Transcript_42799:150-1658(-)